MNIITFKQLVYRTTLNVVILFSLFTISYLLLAIPISAQTACDRCGLCDGGEAPSDYDACVSCLYENPGPPPSGLKNNVSWTVLGCVPTNPGGFIQTIFTFATSIIGASMFIVLLFGGFKVLTSAGDIEQLALGKRLVASAIGAILLTIFAVVILRIAGVEILKLPGLE